MSVDVSKRVGAWFAVLLLGFSFSGAACVAEVEDGEEDVVEDEEEDAEVETEVEVEDEETP